VLTPADTRDKVSAAELRQAANLAANIIAAAGMADDAQVAAWQHSTT